jgi:PAS domain-containing protein
LKAIAKVHGMDQASQGSQSAAGKSARDYAVLRSVACRRVSPAIAKRIESSLRESEARLLLATASAKLGVFERDVQADRSVWLNDRMYEIFGRSRRDGPLTRQHFALEGNGSFFVECRIRLANGAQRWIQINGTFLFTNDGKPSRLLGVVCDITLSASTWSKEQGNSATVWYPYKRTNANSLHKSCTTRPPNIWRA